MLRRCMAYACAPMHVCASYHLLLPASGQMLPPLHGVQIAASVSSHMQELSDLTHSIKYEVVATPTREALTAAWKAWIEEAGEEDRGGTPP